MDTSNKEGPSIVIFGKSAVGKSSLVNMLVGDTVAPISNTLGRYIFDSRVYPAMLQDERRQEAFQLWDTRGLDDDPEAPLSLEGLDNLQHLLNELQAGPGIALLLYCMRAERQSEVVGQNFDLFSEVIFQGKVPVVVVVTGLENEGDMENWWRKNISILRQYGLPSEKVEHTCVTTTRGKPSPYGDGYVYDAEFEESRGRIVDLILNSSLAHPWKRQGSGTVEEVKKFIDTLEVRDLVGDVAEDYLPMAKRGRLVGPCGCQIQ